MGWQAPSLTVKWGDYFGQDPAEQKQTVELTVAALAGKAITRRMAMEKLAPIFGVENVEAALTELEEESQAQAESDLERAQTELEHAHALTSNGDSSKPKGGAARGGAGSGSDPKQAPGGGSGGAAPAKPKA